MALGWEMDHSSDEVIHAGVPNKCFCIEFPIPHRNRDEMDNK
ncbi:hypothetical protein CCACVL1_29873 [Corchorus capsularis]|uniref:Uncharacterized protein n=1 Tax=Corchorus capsularis TaxID=210143 RepID=A0A1R3FZQ1_COCAP|nr:hypothetical protein CCACVL1_29873 [Corchorus capsularis]